MNKTKFINELSKQINYSLEKCIVINEILESNFFISKKNKDKIIEELIQKLGISEVDANHIYDVAIEIINDQLKYKLKHPFGRQDK